MNEQIEYSNYKSFDIYEDHAITYLKEFKEYLKSKITTAPEKFYANLVMAETLNEIRLLIKSHNNNFIFPEFVRLFFYFSTGAVPEEKLSPNQGDMTNAEWTAAIKKSTITLIKEANLSEEELNEEAILKNSDDVENFRTPIILPDIVSKIRINEFGIKVAKALSEQREIFFKPDVDDFVEIKTLSKTQINNDKNKTIYYKGFKSIDANRFVTASGNHINFVKKQWSEKERSYEYIPKHLSKEMSMLIMAMPEMRHNLPLITKLFTIPMPMILDGKITFPNKGYDERFFSYLPPDAPTISKPEMTLNEAKAIFDDILCDFCWKNNIIDKDMAIAALITPFCRGLYHSWNARTPIFAYTANRPRCGKECLAGVTGILWEGIAREEPPISTGEKNGTDSSEFSKAFASLFLEGQKRIHYANNKGHLNLAPLEAIATNPYYSHRLLGKNANIKGENDMELSLSANTGASWEKDLDLRIKKIQLFFVKEDVNNRKFKYPELHKHVLETREIILSAIFALQRNWIDKGMKDGTVAFSSDPEWSRVVGGICEAAGYTNPCILQPDDGEFIGCDEERDMKELFECCYAKYQDSVLDMAKIRGVVMERGLFSYDFDKQGDKLAFGKSLVRYINRELGGYIMIRASLKSRAEYVFRLWVEK